MNDQNFNDNKAKKLVDEDLMNQNVDENVQAMINKPQADPTGIDPADKEFIERVLKLVNDGTIDLFTPSSLMNMEVYNSIDEKCRGIADINAISLLGDIRQIKRLYETGFEGSYQIQNLINRLRLAKERLEEECGNVYII